MHSWEREEEETADPTLTEWLEKHGADKATIATVDSFLEGGVLSISSWLRGLAQPPGRSACF